MSLRQMGMIVTPARCILSPSTGCPEIKSNLFMKNSIKELQRGSISVKLALETSISRIYQLQDMYQSFS
jgi:hypothetical protein